MIRALLSTLVTAALVLILAFAWFAVNIPSAPLAAPVATDAIIVLTGGNGRVEQGLKALAEGEAPVLLISGVGQNVTRQEILMAHATPQVRQAIARSGGEIVLDYVASTTRSNADQTAQFVRERGVRSIRMVTAAYHMPRSMLEFRHQMPGVDIIADPVFPEPFVYQRWWQDAAMRRLVLREFSKYYAAMFLRNRVHQ